MSSLLIFLVTLLPAVVISKDYFTAAVFEHQGRAEITDEKDPLEVKTANIKFFAKATAIAAEHGADIIVFNEYGLFPYPRNRENMRKYAENIPDPKKHTFNPCKEGAGDRFALTSFSCLARDNNIYIVANMLDIQPCETNCYADKIEGCDVKCSDDGVLMYNTNVAFDREGNIVARYHKMHPYFEEVNFPEEPEFVTFDTEFGKFGLIICFDSVFEESHQLVKDYGVDTLIFPTYWFDDIESLNGVEWQQAWALANGVNFLAANTQAAKSGSIGSGIYSKDAGALVYTYDNDGDSKLLMANVRIRGNKDIPQKSSIIVIKDDTVSSKVEETGENFPVLCYKDAVGPEKDLNDYRCFKSQTENFTLTKLQTPSGTVESCNNGFCCSLRYSTKDLQEDWYLAALNGTNNVKNYYYWWEETCLLVRCDPFEGKECVILPSTSKTVFNSFELRAKFDAEVIFATVSKNKFRLAPKTEWRYSTGGSETVLKFQSDSNTPLLKAGLMGRNYRRDPPFVPWYQYTMPEVFYM